MAPAKTDGRQEVSITAALGRLEGVQEQQRAPTHTQDGARTFLRYWQVPWMQKSLYFFRHGFLFFPLPFPLAFPFPFLVFASVLSASRVTDGSLGLLDIATVSQKKIEMH